MKTNNIILVISFLFISSLKAQVLYSEDFESYSIGDVGTDFTGQTIGQGGWFTTSGWAIIHYPTPSFNGLFQIQNDPANRNGITITGHPYLYAGGTVLEKDIDVVLANRINGNDIFKFEVDFYTAQQTTNTLPSNAISFGLDRIKESSSYNPYFYSPPMAGFTFYSDSGEIRGQQYDQEDFAYQTYFLENNQPLILPFDTWIHFVVYADYINNKIIYEIPSLGAVGERDFLTDYPYPDNINNYPPESIKIINGMLDIGEGLPTYRFDNFKVTALNSVLSTEEALSNSFRLYPNPAADLVTITNSDNTYIKQIEIYDLTGKLISAQNYYFEDKTEIQLNVEKLTTGVYLLHLQTDESVSIKKLIKK